ncbi:MAG: phage baseplate protein [Christensenellales bacterium]
MIINLKYNSQTGLLTPMANYTLAQHNHLADQIVVVSNAPDCNDYNYCLEFVCYNTKNVPKAQYVSEILNYSPDGIVFDVPNNLTQFAGFVDVQLTGYSKDNYNVIFKSISKNTKAFSVEGSLSVLDNALSDTPNILTLLQQELDYVREVKETIANDFENLIKNDLGQVLEDFEYSSVEFIFYDKTYCKTYKNNSVITPPMLNLSDDETLLGWVEQGSGRQWDFGQDRVQGCLTLIANVQSVGVEVQEGKLIGYNGSAEDIYVPYCVDGIITTLVDESWQVTSPKNAIYLPIGMSDCANVKPRFFNQVVGGKDTVEKDGIFYDQQGQRLVGMTAGRLPSQQAISVIQGVQSIQDYAFFGAHTTKIVLPDSLRKVGKYAFGDCQSLKQLTMPSNVEEIGDYALLGCDSNIEITLTSANPPTIGVSALEVNSGINAKILVHDWAYAAYRADVNFATKITPLGGVDCISEIDSLQQEVAQNNQTLLARIDGVEQTVGSNRQFAQSQIDALKMLYGVGSIYMSVNSTSPASIFGGTWERIKDRFLLGSGDSYGAGATGGSASVTLTGDNLPNILQVGQNNSGVTKSMNGTPWSNQQYASNAWIITQKSYLNEVGNNYDYNLPHDNMPPYLAVYIWKRTA